MHLPYDAVTTDFERKREAGMYPGAIVEAWRITPPAPAVAGEESIWRRYARENPGLYVMADEVDDDQVDDQVVDLVDEWEIKPSVLEAEARGESGLEEDDQ
jgi:hypothetical protein